MSESRSLSHDSARVRSGTRHFPFSQYTTRLREQTTDGARQAVMQNLGALGYKVMGGEAAQKTVFVLACSVFLMYAAIQKGVHYTPTTDVFVYCCVYCFWLVTCLPWLLVNLDAKNMGIVVGVIVRLFAPDIGALAWGAYKGQSQLLLRGLRLKPMFEPSLSWLSEAGYNVRYGVVLACLVSCLLTFGTDAYNRLYDGLDTAGKEAGDQGETTHEAFNDSDHSSSTRIAEHNERHERHAARLDREAERSESLSLGHGGSSPKKSQVSKNLNQDHRVRLVQPTNHGNPNNTALLELETPGMTTRRRASSLRRPAADGGGTTTDDNNRTGAAGSRSTPHWKSHQPSGSGSSPRAWGSFETWSSSSPSLKQRGQRSWEKSDNDLDFHAGKDGRDTSTRYRKSAPQPKPHQQQHQEQQQQQQSHEIRVQWTSEDLKRLILQSADDLVDAANKTPEAHATSRERDTHASSRERDTHVSSRERDTHPSSRERDTHPSSRERDTHASSRERDTHMSSRERDIHTSRERKSHVPVPKERIGASANAKERTGFASSASERRGGHAVASNEHGGGFAVTAKEHNYYADDAVKERGLTGAPPPRERSAYIPGAKERSGSAASARTNQRSGAAVGAKERNGPTATAVGIMNDRSECAPVPLGTSESLPNPGSGRVNDERNNGAIPVGVGGGVGVNNERGRTESIRKRAASFGQVTFSGIDQKSGGKRDKLLAPRKGKAK